MAVTLAPRHSITGARAAEDDLTWRRSLYRVRCTQNRREIDAISTTSCLLARRGPDSEGFSFPTLCQCQAWRRPTIGVMWARSSSTSQYRGVAVPVLGLDNPINRATVVLTGTCDHPRRHRRFVVPWSGQRQAEGVSVCDRVFVAFARPRWW